jgi:ribosomal protein S18 acetylase RimI-like enzyme
MKETFTLSSDSVPGVALRTIEGRDIESLRLWKNANRASFFFQETIEPEAQRRWFAAYVERPRDFMFVVETGASDVGCMGFRVLASGSDVYNVIRGTAGGPPGAMRGALRVMCSFARSSFAVPVEARVLKSNPAVTWYEKVGFRIATEEDSHYLVRLDEHAFSPVAFFRDERRPGTSSEA